MVNFNIDTDCERYGLRVNRMSDGRYAAHQTVYADNVYGFSELRSSRTLSTHDTEQAAEAALNRRARQIRRARDA